MFSKQQIPKYNEKNIAEFRASGGQVASLGGAPALLLTTTGAKSGQRRVNPRMYLADEHQPDRVYVFASAAGADQNPVWYHNLLAHPGDIQVEIGAGQYQATAEVLPEPQRTGLYAIQASRNPRFAEYQDQTSRPIPVIALTLHR